MSNLKLSQNEERVRRESEVEMARALAAERGIPYGKALALVIAALPPLGVAVRHPDSI